MGTKRNRCKIFNRIIRKGKYMNRQRTNGQCTPNDRFSPSAPPRNDGFSQSVWTPTQKEREDMLTLTGIFPGMNIAKLAHAYMRHKDVQKNGTGTFGIILILKPMSHTQIFMRCRIFIYFRICFFNVCVMFSIKYDILFLNYGYVSCLIGFYLNINLN